VNSCIIVCLQNAPQNASNRVLKFNKKLSYCCDRRSYCMQTDAKRRSAKTATAWYLF